MQQLTLGATASTSSTYAYFAAAAQLINKAVPSVNVTVVETGAAAENMKRLTSNRLDMGLAGPPVDRDAYEGKGDYEGKANKDLRVLWYAGVNAQNIVVRADAGVTKLADLEGKPFCGGGVGTGTLENVTKMFGILGIKPDFFRGSIADCTNAMKERRIVGMGKGGVGSLPDSSILEVTTATPIRLLTFTDDQVAKLKAAGITDSPWMTVPAGVYPGQDYSYQTFGAPLPIVGSTKLSEDMVYRMVKALSEDKTAQEAAYPAFKGWNIPKSTVDYAILPIHKGAIKYFAEVGIKTPPNLQKD